jgi:NADH-quinone oxidoreductase subunit G
MPTFKLDGKEIPFEPGQTIITAAWKAGIEIPHYCWHPGLSVAANCRMCLVEILPPPNQRALMLDIVEWDAALGDYKPAKKPKLQPSCQIVATDGMEVLSDTSKHVLEARKNVQEFLLLHHPVDCPICDQAGECKLQDYWLEHGKFQKRMRDEPIHKPKAVSFGDTIVYDAERCVMCTRCIRFMEEVAKDPVLDMRERGNLKEVFVAQGRKLEGNYTFMVEQVCPVGALTTKDFRFKARVWFLRSAKTVCQGCATGCNAWLDFDPRYNKAYRYRPRDNEEVNKFWMCDPGMLSYRAAHEGRVTDARVNGKVSSQAKALAAAAKALAGASPETLAVVLSASSSLEDNWAMKELAGLLGTERLYFTAAPPGEADDILMHADKNPNRGAITLLAEGAKPFADLARDIESGAVKYAIALGGPTPGGMDDAAALSKLTALVTVAAYETAFTKEAAAVLPATSWAEESATWVNAKGLRQIADRALEPQGASLPGWQQIAALATALGHSPSFTKLKDIRARLGVPNPPRELPQTTDTQAV